MLDNKEFAVSSDGNSSFSANDGRIEVSVTGFGDGSYLADVEYVLSDSETQRMRLVGKINRKSSIRLDFGGTGFSGTLAHSLYCRKL